MIPIIIPYRMAHEGTELKYALRSIETYLKMDYGDIYLIGDKFPKWLQNVKYIQCSEGTEKSSQNILKKIKAGLDVCGTAIQWQDDIFLTRPTEEMPYYYDGTLSDWIAKTSGRYKKLIVNTAMKITDEERYYDVHTPIMYTERYFNLIFKYDWDRKNYIVKTLYGYIARPFNTFCEQITDCKLSQPQGKEEIKAKIGDSLYFSTGPHSLNDAMIEVLNELYPNPSKYEMYR